MTIKYLQDHLKRVYSFPGLTANERNRVITTWIVYLDVQDPKTAVAEYLTDPYNSAAMKRYISELLIYKP